MSEKLSKMIAVIDWQEQIETIAGPYKGNRKSWLSRAADRAGISYRQAKGLFYGEVKNPKHSVSASVLSAVEKARLEEARKDALVVADYCDRHAQALATVDADFFGPEINAFVATARIVRGRGSA